MQIGLKTAAQKLSDARNRLKMGEKKLSGRLNG